ncbi:MAG TPA: glycosyltransferase family 2 protein [Usitatibacter sp.]|jgi:glycosyltransferase involved in cell wall biosynthesis|nr:glycosyltransferase family 2 protein [Usitatibacter sp.]
MELARLAVVIPCFRARDHVLATLAQVGPEVAAIYVVDDACPENTGEHVRANCADARVRVLRFDRPMGRGAAIVRGYREALGEEMDILVKIEPDGRMDPARIASIVRPLLDGIADYAKGNRFFAVEDAAAIPRRTLWRNAATSLAHRMATGYWELSDPANGFTALHATVAKALPLERLVRGDAFELDLLSHLALLRAVVVDVPMPARMDPARVPRAPRFPVVSRALRRVAYAYFLRDINPATFFLGGGASLVALGAGAGLWWWRHAASGLPLTVAGALLIALPVLAGVQLLVAAAQYEIANVPRRPLHAHLVKRKEPDLSATGWVRPGS